MSRVDNHSRFLEFKAFPTLLRSLLPPRKSWKKRLSESTLPHEIQQLIANLLRQSRLLANEKSEVAQELIAHFEDGREQGRQFSELIAEFGDPLVAARLIRQSKERNRPMAVKWLRGGMWLGSFSLAGYLGLALMFYWGQPNPSVNYLPELNRDLTNVDASDLAWPIYRPSFTKYEFCEGPKGHFTEMYWQDAGREDQSRLVKPTDGDAWEKAVQKLKDSNDLLEALREGGTRPALGLALQARIADYSPEDQAALFPLFEADPNSTTQASGLMTGPLVGMILPHIQSFRKAARILHVDTRWAFEQGDWERATQNIEAVFGFSRHASEHRFLISGIVGFAILNLGCDLVDEALASHLNDFSDAQLERIHQAVTRYPARELLDLQGEHAFFRDVIQRVYTDDGAGDGRITAQGLRFLEEMNLQMESRLKDHADFQESAMRWVRQAAAPLALVMTASRKQMTEQGEKLFELVDQRIHQSLYADDTSELDRELSELAKGNPILGSLVPAFEIVRPGLLRSITNQEATAAGVAIHRYQRKHGRLPETWNDLVGEWIPSIPIDPVSGKPLHYLVIASEEPNSGSPSEIGFRLYSVGVDRDDDRGRPIRVDVDGRPVSSMAGAGSAEGVEDAEGEASDVRPMPAGQFHFQIPKTTDGDWILWPRGTSRD